MKEETARLLIMDNDHLTLHLLQNMLIKLLPDYNLLPCVDTGKAAIAKCVSSNAPEFLLADVSMSDMSGLLVTRMIRQENSSTNVLLMTSFSPNEYIHKAIEYGAQGIISKSITEKFVEGIKSIAKQGVYDPGNLGFLSAHQAHLKIRTSKSVLLSARETEVLNLWSEGKTMAEISELLKISSTTVRTHLDNAARKLKVANNRALISTWIRLTH